MHGLAETARRVRAGALSPVEMTAARLQRIAAVDATINAFITVTPDQALDAARRVEARCHAGDALGPLAGVLVALKDLFDTAGVRTTAGSKFFAARVPGENALVVDRLRDAGAVCLGKLNMHEWALGVTNDNPHYGPCRNPYAPDRITGGSSGGSAAALAAGLCDAALGSDTGGSIRIPAALCGVVGLKPTFGRVSLRGVVPLSWSLDHAGPMARSVTDVALLLEVIAGHDAADPGSTPIPVDHYAADIDRGIDGWRVGVVADEWLGEVDAEIRDAVCDAAAALVTGGASVDTFDAPELLEAARLNGLMTTADAAAFHHERMERAPGDFGADVLTRLRRGAGYGAVEYARARRSQTELRRRFESWFTEHGGAYDVILLPTTLIAAPLITGLDAVATAGLLTRLTAPFNFTGLPAMSVPYGLTRGGLPIGLQLVSAPWAEQRLLRAGRALERVVPGVAPPPIASAARA